MDGSDRFMRLHIFLIVFVSPWAMREYVFTYDCFILISLYISSERWVEGPIARGYVMNKKIGLKYNHTSKNKRK